MLDPQSAFTLNLPTPLSTSSTPAGVNPTPLSDPLSAPLLLTGSSVSAVAFIDAALPDYQTLVQGIQPNTAVYVLNPNGDELSQITQVLAGYHNLSSVALFDHGSDGALQLGNSSLNVNNLVDYAGVLQSWSTSLAAGADLLLYGCDVAQDAVGQNLVQQIASLTGATVAASTDLTGSSSLGGNWNLEFSTGKIAAPAVLSDWAQAAYQHVLNTYTVSNLNDSGTGSLRDAIAQANANAGADTINFSVSGTITLTTGQLELTDTALTTINGANAITISGNNASRIFKLGSQSSSGITVALDGLTLSDGNATVYAIKDGGDIYSQNATLTVNNSTFSGSSGRYGGAIANYDGSLTVNNSTFSGNSATAGGGAIETSSLAGTASLTVNNSTFSSNSTMSDGGAIDNEGGSESGSASLTVNNSTISGNSANGHGGGIENFSGNFTINNSIVAGNSASTGREIDESTGFTISTGSYNLFGYSADSGFSTSFSEISYTTPSVGLNQILSTTLANNGGPTQTLALVAGSPAVNAGNPNYAGPLTTDQRGSGFARIVGGRLDIGAFESAYAPPVTSPDAGTAVEAGGVNNGTPGSNATGNVLANDTDPNSGGSLTVSKIAFGPTTGTVGGGLNGNYGTLTLNADGTYTYVVDNTNATVQALNVGQSLADNFTYTAQDALTGLTASSTLTITIQGADDAPVVTNPLSDQTGTVNTPINFTIPAATFSDVDNPTLTLSASQASNPLPSWLTFNPTTGTFSGTPPVGSTGTLALQVTATDSVGSASSTFNLVIQGAPPTTNPDTGTATEAGGSNNGTPGSNATGNVLSNDIDPNNGGTLSVSAIAFGNTSGTVGSRLNGNYGTLTLNAAGTYTYVVDNNNATVQALNVSQNLSETFTYTAKDSLTGLTAANTLTITINGADDAPVLTLGNTKQAVLTTSTPITGLSVSDVDGAPAGKTETVTLTLPSGSGTLNIGNLNGAASTGVGTGTVTLSGTVTQLNAALGTLNYSSTGFTGNTTLSVTASDGVYMTPPQTVALQVAQNLGTLGKGSVELEGSVSSSDPLDLYRFTLTSATSKFHLTLGDLAANADVYILDSNGNVVASSTNSGTRADVLNNLSLAAGTYFVEVQQVSGSTSYALSFHA